MPTTVLPLPSVDDAQVIVPAPAPGPGNWAGAPSAVFHEGQWVLAYRLRRPLGAGRGVATVVATSRDGVAFETVAQLERGHFHAESFERPAVVPLPEGGWRLYLSCATPGSKHWWIEAIDAHRLTDLPRGRHRVVLAGDASTAVKDPVILQHGGGWEMWACEHPLAEAGDEDRMSTAFLTSADGLAWTRRGTVLSPTPGTWDARGTRVSAVLERDPLVVLYDGRATAAENWFETTGVARGTMTNLSATGVRDGVRSPHSDGALRYVSAVPAPDGSLRYFFEAARPDGAHDLMTQLVRR